MARDTRAAIVDAAAEHLRRGDATFTYDGLAAEAGVARQTLYTRFPDRAELIVSAVEQLRAEVADLETLTSAVQLAPTALDALEALLDLHLQLTPPLLDALRAVEGQRALSPGLSEAFEHRSRGRRQLVRLVVTRLAAEGQLAPGVSVDQAADLLGALLTGTFTAELLRERGWTTTQLRDALGRLLAHGLLTPPRPRGASPTNPGGPS